MLMMLFIGFMILADAKFCMKKISSEDIVLFLILLVMMVMSSSLDIVIYKILIR